MKILVFHQGALGDLILSLPAVHSLKNISESVHLHLAARGGLRGLVLKNGLADSFSDAGSAEVSGLFSEKAVISRETAEFLSHFDSAYVFCRRPNQAFLSNIGAYIGTVQMICSVPPEESLVHVRAHQLEQVRSLGGRDLDFPVLQTDDCCSVISEKTLVSIHPGSGGRSKCWPVEKYMELMLGLRAEAPYFFNIILGPAEDERLKEVFDFFISENRLDARVSYGMSIDALSSMLMKSAAYVGNDSGVSHLAAALGTPTAAIFGPTDGRLWGPVGPNTEIVTSTEACSPCGDMKRHVCISGKCLSELPAGAVEEAVKRLLSKARPCASSVGPISSRYF